MTASDHSERYSPRNELVYRSRDRSGVGATEIGLRAGPCVNPTCVVTITIKVEFSAGKREPIDNIKALTVPIKRSQSLTPCRFTEA